MSFLKYADMKRKGETLPEGVYVSLESTREGISFVVAFSNGNRIEAHECDANGNSVFRSYGILDEDSND